MMLLITNVAVAGFAGADVLAYQMAFGLSALLSIVVLIVALWKVRSH